MASDSGEEKTAEEGTMTIDERKAKMEQLRAKMVRGPLFIILLIP
jgi:pre-mRNA-splicing factor SYF2